MLQKIRGLDHATPQLMPYGIGQRKLIGRNGSDEPDGISNSLTVFEDGRFIGHGHGLTKR